MEADEALARLREYASKGQHEEVARLAGLLLRAHPAAGNLWRLQADALLALRRYGDAIASYSRAVAGRPADADIQARMGHCHWKSGDKRAALACLLRAAELDPGRIADFQGLLDAEAISPVASELDDLRRLSGDPGAGPASRMAALYMLAKVLLRSGDGAGAFECQRKANDLRLAGRNDIAPPFPSDALRSQFTPTLYSRLVRDPDEPAPGFAIVTGLSRTGKSLLESLLARHPAIRAGGEIAGLWQVALDRSGKPVLVGNMGSPDKQALLAQMRARLRQIYAGPADQAREQACQRGGATGGARILVDTSPGNLPLLGWLPLLDPRVPVVICERNALDLGLALYRRPFAGGDDYVCDLGLLGRTLAQVECLIDHWQDVLPNPVLRVRYEETVGDPEGTLSRVLAFLGLDPRPAAEAGESVLAAITPANVGIHRQFAAQLAPMTAAYEAERQRLSHATDAPSHRPVA